MTLPGFSECPECEGDGIGLAWPDDAGTEPYPCQPCSGVGVVPDPAWVEPCAQAMHESVDAEVREMLEEAPWLWEQVPESIKVKQRAHARAALLAYARKAKGETMSGRTIVWAVSSGSYSDYRVLGLFPTKELAERAAMEVCGIDKGYRYDAFTESFTLWAADDMPQAVTFWRVNQTWWDDGSITGEDEEEWTQHELATLFDIPSGDRVAVRWVRAPMHKGKGGRIELTGRSLDGCRKVLSEWRARWVAEGPFKQAQIVLGDRDV